MADRPKRNLAVILERVPVESRWATHAWQLAGVVPDEGGEPRTLVEEPALLRRIFPGLAVELFPDESEGYYLNVTTDSPSVFVSLRQDEASGEPYPSQATLSYNEAARWMDGGERVERAVIGPELLAWLREWVTENYRPEPKKRRRPKSFQSKEGRLRMDE